MELSMERRQERIHEVSERVEIIWWNSRPELMRLYDKLGQVKVRTTEAASRYRETVRHLRRKGIPLDQATNLAMYEWVRLPDIEESDKAAILAAARHRAGCGRADTVAQA
jgi:hypothetical protein